MRTADWTESVSVLDRLTAVFEAFGDEDEGLGVSEIARRANLPKSTVSRIAADLVGQQFLEREGDKLFLGVRLFELGQAVEQPRSLRRAALPVMTELRNLTGQTVNLAVLEGVEVVIIATVRGDAASKPPARIGGRLPAHATALGKAILAFGPSIAVSRLGDLGLTRRTPRTICDIAELQRELIDVRRNGIAVEREECVTGRVCVATPISLHSADTLAAISVTGTVDQLVPERMASAVRAAGLSLGRPVGMG